MSETLEDNRQLVADHIYQTFEFGSDVEVEDSSGWEYEVPGTEMTRMVFFRSTSDDQGDSIKGYLTVRFEGMDSFTPAEAYAHMNGVDIGRPAQPMSDIIPVIFPDASPKL